MALSDRFDHALVWAADLHREQTRKGRPVPYVSHLLAVSSLVLEYGGDEDQAIAGLLHDAIEDQGVTDAEIADRYGERVARIVRACTDSDTIPKPPWRERKAAYIDHLADMPAEALLVSLADKVHNARSLAADVDRAGDAYLERFSGGTAGTRWYYRRLADAFGHRISPDSPLSGLFAEFQRALERFGVTEAAAAVYESDAAAHD